MLPIIWAANILVSVSRCLRARWSTGMIRASDGASAVTSIRLGARPHEGSRNHTSHIPMKWTKLVSSSVVRHFCVFLFGSAKASSSTSEMARISGFLMTDPISRSVLRADSCNNILISSLTPHGEPNMNAEHSRVCNKPMSGRRSRPKPRGNGYVPEPWGASRSGPLRRRGRSGAARTTAGRVHSATGPRAFPRRLASFAIAVEHNIGIIISICPYVTEIPKFHEVSVTTGSLNNCSCLVVQCIQQEGQDELDARSAGSALAQMPGNRIGLH